MKDFKDFKVNQLTKVLVMTVIKDATDPCAEAADQVKRVLQVALKDASPMDSSWKWIVQDACQGGMVALLLSKHSVARGAVLFLRAVSEAACDLNLDAARMRDNALLGIADIQRFVGPDEIGRVQSEIAKHFPAAARAFAVALRVAVLNSLQSIEEDEIRYTPD